MALSVNRTKRQAKAVDLWFLQVELRNVVCRRPTAIAPRQLVDFLDLGAKLREVGDHHVALQGALDEQNVGPDRLGEVALRNVGFGSFLGDVCIQRPHALLQSGVIRPQANRLESFDKLAPPDVLVVVGVQRPEEVELARICVGARANEIVTNPDRPADLITQPFDHVLLCDHIDPPLEGGHLGPAPPNYPK